jgi:hypothetical protein
MINVIGTLLVLPPQLEDISIDSYYLAEIKTGVALAYRLPAGPLLGERCKELSLSRINFYQPGVQILPKSILRLYHRLCQRIVNHSDRGSAETVPIRSVVSTPSA